MNRPTIEEIKTSSGFRLVKKLSFTEILSFVFENIRFRNTYTLFYAVLNLAGLAALTVLTIHAFSTHLLTFGPYMSSVGWGTLAGSLLIIPFHEGLHALGFLIIGARKIRFGADLGQAIFYATAENFVAGRKGFTLVALSPVVVINVISLVFIFQVSPGTQVLLVTMLLLHNIMCIGDFAMLSFFRRNKDKELYTFDETESMTAWFYEKTAV